MLKKQDSKLGLINFKLTSYNTVTAKVSDVLYSKLNLGNRLIQKKKDFLLNLLLNFKKTYGYKHYLIIPLDKNFYRNVPESEQVEYKSYDIVNGVVKELLRKGYIRVRPKFSHKDDSGYIHVFPAGYYPTLSLAPYLKKVKFDDIDILRPSSFVILRKNMEDYENEENGVEVPLPDTRLTRKMNKDLEFYNNLREKSSLSIRNLPKTIFNKYKEELLVYISAENLDEIKPVKGRYSFKLWKSYLVRVFNENFKRGGRYYRGTESNMPSKVRKHFYIDGRPTVEYDYSGTHFMLLYNLHGFQLRKDPYMAEKNMTKNKRKVYKTVGFISLNTHNTTQALQALWKHFNKEKYKKLLKDNSRENRRRLINNFIRYNKKIERYLFSEKCHYLTNLDSKIATEILRHFTKKGILVLCVHDSFIIQKRYESELLKVMKKAYKDRIGFLPKIDKK